MPYYEPALKALQQVIETLEKEIEKEEDASLLKSQRGTLQNYRKELKNHKNLPKYKQNKYEFQTDPEHISHIILNLQMRQDDYTSEYFATKGRKKAINQLAKEIQ